MIRQRYETKCVKLSEEPTSSASQKIFKELEVEAFRVVQVVEVYGSYTVIATRPIETPPETREVTLPVLGMGVDVGDIIHACIVANTKDGWEHVATHTPARETDYFAKVLFVRRPVG